jgi:hypothetical protein
VLGGTAPRRRGWGSPERNGGDSGPVDRQLEESGAEPAVVVISRKGRDISGSQLIAYRMRTARTSLALQLHAQTGDAQGRSAVLPCCGEPGYMEGPPFAPRREIVIAATC